MKQTELYFESHDKEIFEAFVNCFLINACHIKRSR